MELKLEYKSQLTNIIMLKAVVVEDEKTSRETLIGYITKYCDNVKVVGEANDVKTGLLIIKKLQPDIVYLDIEMPFGNGFDLLEQVPVINFETIFVTAYSDYAIKAFNSSAAFYLLKPVDIDELVSSTESVGKRVIAKKNTKHTNVLLENIQSENKQLQKIVLPTMDGFEIVKVNEIIRCKADNNYTEIYLLNGKKHIISKTLKFYEDLLKEMDFVRVHKTHLVNIQYVKKYTKGKGGFATMQDGSEVEVSSSKKENFMKFFK